LRRRAELVQKDGVAFGGGERARGRGGLLLDRMKGADVAAKDDDGRTALHLATEGGHTSTKSPSG
jgi:hypothetical protein